MKSKKQPHSKQKLISALVLSAFGLSIFSGLAYRFLDAKPNEQASTKQESSEPLLYNGTLGLYTTNNTVYAGQSQDFPILYTQASSIKVNQTAKNNNLLASKETKTSTLLQLPASNTSNLTYFWYEDGNLIATTKEPSLNLSAQDFNVNVLGNSFSATYNFKLIAKSNNTTLTSTIIPIKLISTDAVTLSNTAIYHKTNAGQLIAETSLHPYYEQQTAYTQVLDAGNVLNKDAINVNYSFYVKFVQTDNYSQTNPTASLISSIAQENTILASQNKTNNWTLVQSSASNLLVIDNNLFTNNEFGFYEFLCVVNAKMSNGAKLHANTNSKWLIDYVKPGNIALSPNWTTNTYYGLKNDPASVSNLQINASFVPIDYANEQATFSYTWQELNANGDVIKTFSNNNPTFDFSNFSSLFANTGTILLRCVVNGTFLGATLPTATSPIYTLQIINPVFSQANYENSYNIIKQANQSKFPTLNPEITAQGVPSNILKTTISWNYNTNHSAVAINLPNNTLILSNNTVYNIVSVNVGVYTFNEIVTYQYLNKTITYQAKFTVSVYNDPTTQAETSQNTTINYLIGQTTPPATITSTFKIGLSNVFSLNAELTWQYKITGSSKWTTIAKSSLNGVLNEENLTISNSNNYYVIKTTMPWNTVSKAILNTARSYEIEAVLSNTIDEISSQATSSVFIFIVSPIANFTASPSTYLHQTAYVHNSNTLVDVNYLLTANSSYLTTLTNTNQVTFNYEWYYQPVTVSTQNNKTIYSKNGNPILLNPTLSYPSYYNTTNTQSSLQNEWITSLNAGTYEVYCVVSYNIASLGVQGNVTGQSYVINLLDVPSLTFNQINTNPVFFNISVNGTSQTNTLSATSNTVTAKFLNFNQIVQQNPDLSFSYNWTESANQLNSTDAVYGPIGSSQSSGNCIVASGQNDLSLSWLVNNDIINDFNTSNYYKLTITANYKTANGGTVSITLNNASCVFSSTVLALNINSNNNDLSYNGTISKSNESIIIRPKITISNTKLQGAKLQASINTSITANSANAYLSTNQVINNALSLLDITRALNNSYATLINPSINIISGMYSNMQNNLNNIEQSYNNENSKNKQADWENTVRYGLIANVKYYRTASNGQNGYYYYGTAINKKTYHILGGGQSYATKLKTAQNGKKFTKTYSQTVQASYATILNVVFTYGDTSFSTNLNYQISQINTKAYWIFNVARYTRISYGNNVKGLIPINSRDVAYYTGVTRNVFGWVGPVKYHNPAWGFSINV